MFCASRDGYRKSKMGPSFRWDDGGGRCAFHIPSFQRTLESMSCESRDGRRKSKMGPSFRWDDGDDYAFHAVIPANAGIHVPC
jgi:hypothetical protein